MSDEKLVKAAARLARTSPEAWNELLGALALYDEKQRDNLVASPLDRLPIAQGHAQATSRLLDLLRTCTSRADKYESKHK